MTAIPNRMPSSAGTTRTAVLEELRAAFPEPVGSDRLHAVAGRPYPSRIGELRERGWSVEIGTERPAPSYRLLSFVKGEPDPVMWGLKRTWARQAGSPHRSPEQDPSCSPEWDHPRE